MIPKSLFRYYPASLLSLENLKKQCLYFGSVDAFNDPFECSIANVSPRDNPEALSVLRERYSAEAGIPEHIKRQIREMDGSAFAEMMSRIARERVEDAKRAFIARRGVVCFAERNENLLMWSHYSSGGSGMCLEFRTDHEMFEKAEKVTYSKAPPALDPLAILASLSRDEQPAWIADMYCTKPDDWRYEEEWRVIHREKGTAYTYPKELLKAVYFGPKCAMHFIEIACLTLLGQNRDVEFWRGAIGHTEYKVSFERFTYTTFADIPKPHS